MKTISNQSHRASTSTGGFSLIEMIGVLAIIAILAAVVLPKVFSSITSARVTNSIMSVGTVRTAATDFASKYGILPLTNNNSRLDDLFIAAGTEESRFAPKIGLQGNPNASTGATWKLNTSTGVWSATGGSSQTSNSRIICQLSTTANPYTANGANFRLDGRTNLPTGSRVVSAVLMNVPAAEAREMSQRMDGDALSATNTTSYDNNGKVVYAAPVNGSTTVYVYVVHQ